MLKYREDLVAEQTRFDLNLGLEYCIFFLDVLHTTENKVLLKSNAFSPFFSRIGREILWGIYIHQHYIEIVISPAAGLEKRGL